MAEALFASCPEASQTDFEVVLILRQIYGIVVLEDLFQGQIIPPVHWEIHHIERRLHAGIRGGLRKYLDLEDIPGERMEPVCAVPGENPSVNRLGKYLVVLGTEIPGQDRGSEYRLGNILRELNQVLLGSVSGPYDSCPAAPGSR